MEASKVPFACKKLNLQSPLVKLKIIIFCDLHRIVLHYTVADETAVNNSIMQCAT